MARLGRSIDPAALLATFLAGLLFASHVLADGCRIAFDIGSSGVRAGSDMLTTVAQADIDYLGPQWAGRPFDTLAEPTIDTLRRLPEKAGFPRDCARFGGGFSAWRLAHAREGVAIVPTLARIAAASGTAVLIVPQQVEGAYAHASARSSLTTLTAEDLVLDIGGGSLQISGAHGSVGGVLGQKAWHRELCQALRNSDNVPCALQPLTGEELTRARSFADHRLDELAIRRTLPGAGTLVAVSRPVTRGVAPAVRRLQGSASNRLALADLTRSTTGIAALDAAATAALVDSAPRHAAFLLSDMLLVEGLLRAAGKHELGVTEADISNLPAMLADDRAYAWAERYTCYLVRLATMGINAYFADPATCNAGE